MYFIMKGSFLLPFLAFFILVGCDLSDDFEKLPGGHTYVREGSCYKYITVNIKNSKEIPSCVQEYKYDEKFITVAQIDSLECEQVGGEMVTKKNFYIIDVQNDIVF